MNTNINPIDLSFLNNPLLDTDSYKPSHFKQLPPGSTYVESYLTARKGDWVLFVGYQFTLRTLMLTKITKEMVEEAKSFWTAHGEPFNEEGWMYIVDKCNGYIPVNIWAVPEGTKVDCGLAMLGISCSDPNCLWVVQWLETATLRLWAVSNVATNSRKMKLQIQKAFEKSSCSPTASMDINFKLHDFGSRGVSSSQSAAYSGSGHLMNFMGSDTGVALMALRKFYGADMAGFSIPASEHGTMTPWINMPGGSEVAAYENMIDQFGDGNIFACVSDSVDIENAVSNIWGGVLKDKVMAMNATLVIRPDSGDPIEWLPKLLTLAADKFGFEVNEKGYKVLNKVRFIQGDGITVDTLGPIMDTVMEHGFSIDNLAFGMGGGLLQMHNRDTYGWAMKVSHMVINGENVRVFKDPVTDPGKKSKSGMLRLYRDLQTGGLVELDRSIVYPREVYQGLDSVQVTVYSHEAGRSEPFVRFTNLEEVKANIAQGFGGVW